MTIKVLVLKSGEDVIADVQEMMSSSDQVIGYFLNKPCVVKLQAKEALSQDVCVRMHPWMPLARETMIPVSADWVVTMVTPVESIQEMYEKKVLADGKEETTNQTTSSDEQSEDSNTD